MASSKFDAFPPCCRQILVALEQEQRRGARNCENGHLVSLDYAELMNRQPPSKKPTHPAAD
jgi:hypothetical protein